MQLKKGRLKARLAKISEKLDKAGRSYVSIDQLAQELVLKEKELQEKEKKYRRLSDLFRAIVDTVPEMVWAKNLNDEYLFTNAEARRKLFKIEDYDQILGKRDSEVFKGHCKRKQVVATSSGWQVYIKEVSRNGERLTLIVRQAPLLNKYDEQVGSVSVARDVSQLNGGEIQRLKIQEDGS